MTTRLHNLEVQEVSLVDDPAVPKARYLITKRRDDSGSTPDPVTDIKNTDENLSVLERIGKSVMDLLGGVPSDEQTRVRLAAGIAKAAGEPEDVEKADEDVEKAKGKCPGCGRFMSANSRHRDADEKEKAAEADAEASEEEAEKAAESEAEEASEDQAEKAEADEEADEAEAEEEAEKASDPNAALLESFKSMLETELAPIRESIGKAATADAVNEIGERVETLEKRKGISKVAKGSDTEANEAAEESVFGDVIFGG